MTGASVELIFEYMAQSAVSVWDALCRSHPSLLAASSDCETVVGKRRIGEVRALIQRRRKPQFVVKCGQLEAHYGHVGNYGHSLLRVEHVVKGFDDAWDWIAPLAESRAFRQARVLDDDYEHWQNADDPLEYTSAGRSYAGLPTKSNGLPYPLEQMIIDTSRNPGRRVLRQGYVEAVGAVMWLGRQFWSLTGARREEVLAQGWLKCEELPEDVLRVQTANAPFTTAEGPSGELQDRLRALLFPMKADGS